MRLLAVAALFVSLAACGGLRRAPPENAGLGAITAVTMQKTACQLTCPAYIVRFTADGRARYSGGSFAPHQGRFSGLVDFAPLAAWIATQHPETLPDTFPKAMIDDQAANLQIDYGVRRVRFTGVSESSASLRLEGILLALDGATARIRWRRDDSATPFLGAFRGGTGLYVSARSDGTFAASTTPVNCPYGRYRITRSGATMRLRCETRTTVLRAAGDDLRANGDAIPPGRYERVNPRAIFPADPMVRRGRPTE